MARGKKQEYLCIECGTKMEKADEEVLVCPNCNHSVEIVDYGHENDYAEYFLGDNKACDNDDNYDPDADDEESTIEEAIDNLRGTIPMGDCIYCNAKNGMKYVGNICFVCSKCGQSVHEDIYYRWTAGYRVDLG